MRKRHKRDLGLAGCAHPGSKSQKFRLHKYIRGAPKTQKTDPKAKRRCWNKTWSIPYIAEASLRNQRIRPTSMCCDRDRHQDPIIQHHAVIIRLHVHKLKAIETLKLMMGKGLEAVLLNRSKHPEDCGNEIVRKSGVETCCKNYQEVLRKDVGKSGPAGDILDRCGVLEGRDGHAWLEYK